MAVRPVQGANWGTSPRTKGPLRSGRQLGSALLRLGKRRRIGPGELALASRSRVGMGYAADSGLVNLGHRRPEVGLGLLEVLLLDRHDGFLHGRLDPLLGDPVAQPPLLALTQPLGRRGRIWHGSYCDSAAGV